MQMTAEMRSVLTQYVHNFVRDEEAHRRYDMVRFKITEQLYQELIAKYNPSDMVLLEKYACSQQLTTLYIKFRTDEANCTPEEYCVELLYKNPENDKTLTTLLAPRYGYPELELYRYGPSEILSLCQESVQLKSEARKATSKLRDAYDTIIDTAKHLEQVCEVWPEAVSVIAQHNTTQAKDFTAAKLLIQKGGQK